MRKLLPAIAVFAALSPFARAEDKAPETKPAAPAAVAPEAPATPAVKVPEIDAEKKKLFLQAFGWMVAKRNIPAQFEFTEDEITQILEGTRLAVAGKGEDFPSKMMPLEAEYSAYLQGRYAKGQEKEARRIAEEAKTEKAKGAASIKAEAEKDKTIVVEPSGLAYKILDAGKGDKPKAEAIVSVKYKGTLIDGTEFDSTEKHGGQPTEFQLNQVVRGWTEGLQKIAKGGKIKLWIPSDLGYGDAGRPDGGIKPGATLVFEVELLDIKDAPKEEAPVAPAAKAPEAK